MRTAVIYGSTVANVIEADAGFEVPGALLVASDEARPGWSYDLETGAFSAPDLPPAPPPETISSRQFFQQLANEGVIGQDDALAYVSTGVLPKAMLDAIGQLPAEQQFAVKMAVIGANTFDRHNPMTAQLGMILSKDDAALDELWRRAFLLP